MYNPAERSPVIRGWTLQILRFWIQLHPHCVVVSLNEDPVEQTKGSIQIFSLDVLRNGEVHNQVRTSHFYPLSKNRIVCVLRLARSLTLPELETRWEFCPDDDTSHRRSKLNHPHPVRHLVTVQLQNRVPHQLCRLCILVHSRTCLWRMSTLGDAHQGEACALTFYTGLYHRIGELERQIQVPYNVVASLLEYTKSEITPLLEPGKRDRHS